MKIMGENQMNGYSKFVTYIIPFYIKLSYSKQLLTPPNKFDTAFIVRASTYFVLHIYEYFTHC